MSEDKCPCCGMIPCSHNALDKETDYKACLLALMEGLEVEQIDVFMVTVHPDRCRRLGQVIAERTKVIVWQNYLKSEQQKLLEKVKEHENPSS